MKAAFTSLCFLLLSVSIFRAQNNCAFSPDTLFLPKESKTVSADYLQASFKNGSSLRLYKTPSNKYYLKLVVTENLYFDKVDLLEIQSGSKSFYSKDTKQLELSKSAGYFVVEIYKNYVATLREEGVTGILFGKVETSFTRSDANQVKQIAKCFYATIETKK